jgi:hypothetical protein
MGILLAFAPFFGYVIVERILGVRPGLLAGAIIAALLLIRGWGRTKSASVLEAGTLFLFAGLAAYAFTTNVVWSIVAVRLRVDAGLLLIVLTSLAMRRPFTLQYARQTTSPELWRTPEFVRVNYVITSVWAAAFAVMVAADMLMLYRSDLPLSFGIGATVLAIAGAAYFTQWYPESLKTAA